MLELVQALAQARRDFLSPGGGLHAVWSAHEQFVVQQFAQPPQRMTDRRLGQAQPFPGPRDAAFLRQRVKHTQQIEVQGREMNFRHDVRDQFSFGSWKITPYLHSASDSGRVLRAGIPS